MLDKEQLDDLKGHGRKIYPAKRGDAALGPLKRLPGVWKSQGRGWNMIALPFATEPGSPADFRLLLNQYNEELKFELVDKAIPNRGIHKNGIAVEADQFLVALDYEQTIHQVAAVDSPVSGKAGAPNLAIHHEPGLWLSLTNEVSDGFDVARLATIPHGDSVLALGKSAKNQGASVIPKVNG